jgi:hypothetical protein
MFLILPRSMIISEIPEQLQDTDLEDWLPPRTRASNHYEISAPTVLTRLQVISLISALSGRLRRMRRRICWARI